MLNTKQSSSRFSSGFPIVAAWLFLAGLSLVNAQGPSASYVFLSSATLDALDSRLQSSSAGKTVGVNEPLNATLATVDINGRVTMFHGRVPNLAETHEGLSEFALVRSGSGSVSTGGRLIDGRISTSGEIRGTAIEGGNTTRVAVGDLIYIPAKMPHRFIPDAGKHLSAMVFNPIAIQAEDQPSHVVFWSAEKLNALDKELASRLDATRGANSALVSFGNARADRRAILYHRAGPSLGESHENTSDFILVRSGSGAVILGGAVIDARVQEPGEIRGPGISGGTRQNVAAGDVLYIPANLPYQRLGESERPLSLLTIKFRSK